MEIVKEEIEKDKKNEEEVKEDQAQKFIWKFLY